MAELLERKGGRKVGGGGGGCGAVDRPVQLLSCVFFFSVVDRVFGLGGCDGGGEVGELGGVCARVWDIFSGGGEVFLTIW